METKTAVAKRAKLDQLVRDKDAYLVQFRSQARLLTSELEEDLAEGAMKSKIDAMNPAEKQAMRAGLEAEKS